MYKFHTICALFISLSIFSSLACAQTLQDVIYKKDGTVLRGTLIEQDFTNGRYKIQLSGGSVFSVTKEDIEKISKEAALTSTAATENGININIQNNPSINQTPSIVQSPTIQAYGLTPQIDNSHRHTVMIGRLAKTVDNEDENGILYRGVSFAYQFNFDENIAFYADFNRATLEGRLIEGEAYKIPFINEDDYTYQGLQAMAILSTNNYQGWQFYTGLGLFNESFDYPGNSTDVSGINFALGMGYSWKTVQLHFRLIGQASDDYDKLELGEDMSGSTANLQLGFNF